MKIIIRTPNWIGDTILSMPTVKNIRMYYKNAEITIITLPHLSKLWENISYIDNIVIFEKSLSLFLKLRKTKYDIGILLPNSFSSAFWFFIGGVKKRIGYATDYRGFMLTKKFPYNRHRNRHLMEEYLDILGCIKIPISEFNPPEFKTTSYDDAKAEVLLLTSKVIKDDELIGIAPSAVYGPAKRWFPERFIEVGRELVNKYKVKILVLGKLEEKNTVEFIQKSIGDYAIPFYNISSLKTVSAIIKKCKVFISNDTGIMHIAAALGVPVVAIFGSSTPLWTAPKGGESKIIYKNIFCSPCFKRKCRYKTYECLAKVSVDEVLKATCELFVKTK